MRHIIYLKDTEYDQLGEMVEIELKLIGAWLYLQTPIERIALNKAPFKFDGVPQTVLDLVLNIYPNELFTVFHLQDHKVPTSRSFRDIIYQAGIRGYVRDMFVVRCDNDYIEIKNKITINAHEAAALMQSIK